MSIHVAILEDDESVRNNLAEYIEGSPGFTCVAACASTEEALRRLPGAAPDVVLVDINLPRKSGVDFVREFKNRCQRAQMIMLTVEEDSKQVFESLKAGATGYLIKDVPPEKILAAIQEVQRGGAPMSSQVARMVVSTFRAPSQGSEVQLTRRESEILNALARGRRSKEIADELGIGVTTVNTHIRHIYEKLHARSRAEAVARFVRG